MNSSILRIAGAVGLCAFMAGSGASALTKSFDFQPVVACEPAPFDAACGTTATFSNGLLQSIFNQIDIFVNILPQVQVNLPATFISDPLGDPNAIGFMTENLRSFGEAVGNAIGLAANTVYMGFTGEIDGNTLGFAFVHSVGTPEQHIQPFGLLEGFADPAVGLAPFGGITDPDHITRLSTAVLAHEIGHVLGGTHELAGGPFDLMQANLGSASYSEEDFVPTISAANGATIFASNLLEDFSVLAVPLPGSLLLLASGFTVIGTRRRRRPA